MTIAANSSGLLNFTYQGESLQTWYKLVGDLSSSQTPLVIVNGGPGAPHLYVLPHTLLHDQRGIPVLFYDQVGSGQSTHLKGKSAEFWSVDLYVAELGNLLSLLGISDNFDLLGHSWGGMLVQEFVIRRQPRGLRHLVLADTLASMEMYIASVSKLLRAMPQELQDAVKKNEEAGTTSSKEYQDACTVFYQKHLCKLDPWPKDLAEGLAALEEDPTVYGAMQGPSEFTVTGTLKEWSILDSLHLIATPTLIINGADDTCQDSCVGPIFHKIRKAKWVQFAKSGHTPFWDEQERYMQVVGDWLCDTF
ncbi:proline-specific peptidase [Vararia minispora EC-137]|uniref:Proline-specific peptidase n=1 Tax=Vararia minispora EC-137 TaxID=1314806 RepID=A0ACB8QH86_9AGAM|nr:proline-specific peptidase [Vararia minispora EC-137]